MISVARARQQATDLLGSGDPDRSVMVMTTLTKLAVLNLHLAIYIEMMVTQPVFQETIDALQEIHSDVQKTIRQILQQEFPQS